MRWSRRRTGESNSAERKECRCAASWERSVASIREFVRSPQLGKTPSPKRGHRQSADASKDHGGNGAEPLGSEARFELAELVGCSDEDHVHSVDAAAHFIRRAQLNKHLANDHADHVRRANQEESSK